MDTQFKKGSVELCVLSLISEQDRYGYEVVNELNNYYEISINTIYPILRRLTHEGVLATYEIQYEDRKRKYYTLTNPGVNYFTKKKQEWLEFNDKVMKLLDRGHKDER